MPGAPSSVLAPSAVGWLRLGLVKDAVGEVVCWFGSCSDLGDEDFPYCTSKR